jgi:regulator of sigma E protease
MFVEILIWIAIGLAVFLLFGLTIFVHELGHFLAARWRGLVVERFAIGFGPRVWGKTINGVDWCICAIPFGGFVALPQLAPMEMIEGKAEDKEGNKSEVPAQEIPPAKPLDKIIAAFAGPLFSGLFGILLALIVWGVGKPTDVARATTVVGWVDPEMPAAQAEIPILPGDKIIAINNRPVRGFAGNPDGIVESIVFSSGPTLQVDLERTRPGGIPELITTLIVPAKDEMYELRRIGIEPARRLLIQDVTQGSPAAAAGLRPGDEVLVVNGMQMFSPQQAKAIIVNSRQQSVRIEILRDGKKSDFSMIPQVPTGMTEPYIGVRWKDRQLVTVYPEPLQLLRDSLISIGRTAQAVTNPQSDIKAKHLSGPIGIMQTYLLLLREDVRLVLWFSVVLNINLAVLNLLPVPVVDGGHILLSLIEAAARRPLPHRFVNAIQSAFAVLLIGFMLYVTFFDATRSIKTFRAHIEDQKAEEAAPVLEFPPEPSPEPAHP